MDQLKKDHFFEILEKFQAGNATTEEVDFLNAYYQSFGLKHNYTAYLTADERNDLQESVFKNIQSRIRSETNHQTKVVKIKRTWPRIAAAAILIMSLSAGLFVYRHKAASTQSFTQNDIKPGSNKAILTLSNGKQIVLTGAKNGNLAKENNAVINKSADGQLVYSANDGNTTTLVYNTMSTPRGGQYTLTLADGTTVTLNAASSIKYPTAFTGKERLVELTGEAYFEVAHNAARPFKVVTGKQVVEVLGTHFNINAYQDENGIKTTLLEGAVKVSGTHGDRMIKPGQESILINDNLSVNEGNIEEAVAWKNGYFRFNDMKIANIMRQLSRWYDIDVKYDGEMSDEGYNGKISKYRNISQVLQVLEQTKSVHFKIEGRRVVVLR